MADMDLEIVTDAKGRPDPEDMTDTQMLREMLILMRGVQDAIEAISDNPMIKNMLGL